MCRTRRLHLKSTLSRCTAIILFSLLLFFHDWRFNLICPFQYLSVDDIESVEFILSTGTGRIYPIISLNQTDITELVDILHQIKIRLINLTPPGFMGEYYQVFYVMLKNGTMLVLRRQYGIVEYGQPSAFLTVNQFCLASEEVLLSDHKTDILYAFYDRFIARAFAARDNDTERLCQLLP